MAKYLIDSNFKVVRKGKMVAADEKAGEYVYDTNNQDLTLQQLKEIAEANKLSVSGKKKDEYQTNLNEALAKMKNVPTQDKPTETQIVEKIVSEGVEKGLEENQILINLVTEGGVSFKNANKRYFEAMEKLGLRIKTKDLKEKVKELLEELKFSPSTYEDVENVQTKIVEEVEGAQKGQALVAIRAFVKEHGIPMPKRSKGQRGAVGFTGKVYEFIQKNPTADKKQLVAFLDDATKSARKPKDPEKLAKRFMPILTLVQTVLKEQNEAA